jgi:hypothetical protein
MPVQIFPKSPSAVSDGAVQHTSREWWRLRQDSEIEFRTAQMFLSQMWYLDHTSMLALRQGTRRTGRAYEFEV